MRHPNSQSIVDQKNLYGIDRPMGISSILTVLNRNEGATFGTSKRLFSQSPSSVPIKHLDIGHPKDLDFGLKLKSKN